MTYLFWIVVFVVYGIFLAYILRKTLVDFEIKKMETEKRPDMFEQIYRETMKELQDND